MRYREATKAIVGNGARYRPVKRLTCYHDNKKCCEDKIHSVVKCIKVLKQNGDDGFGYLKTQCFCFNHFTPRTDYDAPFRFMFGVTEFTLQVELLEEAQVCKWCKSESSQGQEFYSRVTSVCVCVVIKFKTIVVISNRVNVFSLFSTRLYCQNCIVR